MAVVAAVVASVALTACGGGGSGSGPKGPSALDPANRVPASAIMYVSLTVRPQGSLSTDLRQAIDSVAGKGAATHLYKQLDRSIGKQLGPLKGWLGQRVGIALTGWPADLESMADSQELLDDLVIVAPTNDPAAARRFLAKHAKGADESGKVVGDYAIFGGQNAVGQALAVTGKTSLAASPRYSDEISQLGGGELASFYLPLHPLLEAMLPLLRSSGQLSASAIDKALKSAPADAVAAFGATAIHNGFRLDLVTHGTPAGGAQPVGVPSDVSSLPGGSWLAATLSREFSKQSYVSSLVTGLPKVVSTLQAQSGVSGVPNGPLQFVLHDLLPALGPMSLSVSGTSPASLHAGVVMAPLDHSAGARLASALKQMLEGLPVTVQTAGSRLVTMFGYTSAQQLLNPSSHLADDPTFKSALKQLPAGAKADLFLDFGPVATLSSLDQSAGDAAVWRVVKRLSYLIAGGTATHYRLVVVTR